MRPRQVQPKGASVPERAVDADRSVHRMDEPLAEGEAEAGPFHGRLFGAEAIEWSEKPRQFFDWNSGAGIAHRIRVRPLLRFQKRNGHTAPMAVYFTALESKFEQHLFQPLAIGENIGRAIERIIRRKRDGAFRSERTHQVERLADRFLEANRFDAKAAKCLLRCG